MNHRRPMLPRDRVLAALGFRPSDVPPLRIAPAPGGLYEHGQKLLDLTKACGHDFGDLSGLRLPEPPKPEDFDPDGRYHAIRTDAWGTTWEYRIFGIWGHPIKLPLSDMAKLSEYRPPPAPPTEGPAGEKARAEVEAHKRRWFCLRGAGGIFEKLCSLRGYEDAVVDIALDTPEINRAADMLVDCMLACVRHALAVGADAVIFGDDFGTQRASTFAPHVWKRFFKPRYEILCEPIRKAGKSI
ncbi:MAG: hypothetical protein FJ272_16985, partial [Planctomycetes bacterium]|nr:hypothetical protein [Planctomycetota bacterium]